MRTKGTIEWKSRGKDLEEKKQPLLSDSEKKEKRTKKNHLFQ